MKTNVILYNYIIIYKYYIIISTNELPEIQIGDFSIKTRNAMRCNNRNDLIHLSFTLKISIFSEAYI